MINEIVEKYNKGMALTDIAKEMNTTQRNIKRDLIESGVYEEKVYNIDTDYEKAKQEYIDGISIKKICSKYKIGHQNFTNKLKLDGIQIRGKSSTELNVSSEMLEDILIRFNTGESIRSISKALGVNRHKLSLIIKNAGVNVTPRSPQKYSYYEDVFEKIDTPEKAYWLGMLYADGYINGVEHRVFLKLQDKDKEHVEKFAEFCGDNVNVFKDTAKTPAGEIKPAWRAQILCKKIKTDLIDKGCIPKKTKIIKFPTEDKLPKELINHFVRGYFDGDGCIFRYTSEKNNKDYLKVSIASASKSFILELKEIIPVDFSLYKDTKGIYSLYINGKQKAVEFLDWIYNNSTISLDRKEEVYRQYVSECMPSSDESR